MNKLTLLSIVAVFMTACSGRPQSSATDSLAGVKEMVFRIDSLVNSMYGWSPGDSLYDSSIDVLVADIVDAYNATDPKEGMYGDRSEENMRQKKDLEYATWSTFKTLCENGNYEAALNFFLEKNESEQKSNAGQILLFLKHSTHRYVFLSEVLWPLLREYRDDAADLYIEELRTEKTFEDMTIVLHAAGTNYIPEVYPYVVTDLGSVLAHSGEMDEAQNLFDDLTRAVFCMSEDALYANFCGVQYSARLYLQEGMDEQAIASWQNFKEYLENNESAFPENEWRKIMEKIDQEIREINGR